MKKRFSPRLNKSKSLFKWLYPGIGIKRWMALSAFGVILVILGSSDLRSDDFWILEILDAFVLISGIILLILGVKEMMRSSMAAFMPASRTDDLVDILYQRTHLGRGPKIVTIGGGTGLSVLLSGLKEYTSNISAIVTVADDGGSSGRLREQFDILPPGDIRNCLVALSDMPDLMRNLFQFRFDSNSDLAGHSFGNLFITAMTRLTGDFEKAIKETSRVLALKGQVIPSSLDKVVLVAQHKDGSITEGEDKIPKARKPIKKVVLRPEYPRAAQDAIKAIQEAQIIILGPGSLYTSIIPNLLVKDMSEALKDSEAIKVYVCNIMTQPGETDGYKVSDHIKAIEVHSHNRVFDYCIVNVGKISDEVMKKYSKEDSYPVVADIENIEGMGYRVIEDDIVVIDNFVRHDCEKLAKIILGLVEEI